MNAGHKFVACFVFTLPALGGCSNADTPTATATDFAGYVHFCDIESSGGGEIVETRPDGTIVSAGKKNVGNHWVVHNSIMDGIEENEASAEFNPKTGTGSAIIVGHLVPAAVNGHWLSWQRLRLSAADGDTGAGIGIGTGDLLGKIMIFATGTVEMDVDSPCGPIVSVPLDGTIIDLAGS